MQFDLFAPNRLEPLEKRAHHLRTAFQSPDVDITVDMPRTGFDHLRTGFGTRWKSWPPGPAERIENELTSLMPCSEDKAAERFFVLRLVANSQGCRKKTAEGGHES